MPRPPSLWKELTWAYQDLLLTYALTRCQGDVAEAAKLLGISQTILYRRLRLPRPSSEEHEIPIADRGGRQGPRVPSSRRSRSE